MVTSSYNQQQNGGHGLSELSQGDLIYKFNRTPLVDQYADVLNAYKKRCF